MFEKANDVLIRAKSREISDSARFVKKMNELYKRHPFVYNALFFSVALLVIVLPVFTSIVPYAFAAGGGSVNGTVTKILQVIGDGVGVIGGVILARGILDLAIGMKDPNGGGQELTTAARYIGAGAAVMAAGVLFSVFLAGKISATLSAGGVQ